MSINKYLPKLKIAVCIFLALVFGLALFYFFWRANILNKKLEEQKRLLSGRVQEEEVIKEKLTKTQNELNRIQADYARLQKDQTDLKAEYEKLLTENKELLPLRETQQKLEQEHQGALKEKEKIALANKELQDSILNLKGQINDLTTINKQLIKEKEQLQERWDKFSKKTGLENLERQLSETRKALSQLEEENKKKDAALKEAEQAKIKAENKAQELSQKLDQINKSLLEAVDKNRRFEQRLMDTPAQVAELARQNKALIRRTATMHYNLGVFYANRKEYGRAVAEFEKAIELCPDDASSYFNLGYIYAEQLVDRPKAIRYFQQYLRYAKKGDKDVDWVKKYIVTWQAFDSKQPME